MPIDASNLSVLLMRAAGRICAIPLANVVETMRPLPTEPVPDMPPFLHGLAVIRGAAVPVVGLGALFAVTAGASARRFVLLRLDDRRVALAVEAVLGLCELDDAQVQSFPPLLRDARSELVATIGVRDRELLLVLQATRIVPDEIWQALPTTQAVP